MPHYDLSTYLADDALHLTGVVSEKYPDGKTYTIKSPSAAFGLLLRRAMAIRATTGADRPPTPEELADLIALTTGEDGKPVDLETRLMGGTRQEMADDGVSADRLEMIWGVVLAHYGSGEATARLIIEQSSGEASAPDQQDRDGATTGPKSGRGSTVAAKPTRRRASRASSSTPPNASEEQARAV